MGPLFHDIGKLRCSRPVAAQTEPLTKPELNLDGPSTRASWLELLEPGQGFFRIPPSSSCSTTTNHLDGSGPQAQGHPARSPHPDRLLINEYDNLCHLQAKVSYSGPRQPLQAAQVLQFNADHLGMLIRLMGSHPGQAWCSSPTARWAW